MSIKIIGAGLPRTGTNTLKESLERLGYNKTYHMKELLVHPENLHHWLTLKETGMTKWEELYNGYEATVDFPGYPWYKEHMKQYPDAKVILTIRPFEKWYTSIYSTIWQAGPQNISQKIAMMSKLLFNPHLRSVIKCVKFAKGTIFGVHLQGQFEDKVFAEKIFDKHIADVKAYVPADKLLVYDVSEGWAPLCKFLGVPEPNESFPHLNKKENFKAMLVELMEGHMV
ncbi:sulfotransferase family protein [Adhaeribacter radiodurans]|uniref:Sulfotransferase family protein n=1 Tax=Adhaeribacter radiodurans TaxID=2745197 RepID=A0A7L7L5U3_9BACT|nr:sulfotransferase family protein [Adhaeribacter radiodurans]QMU28150.1 sulfotransferase family protein [Adhaeribacter radiodurans]